MISIPSANRNVQSTHPIPNAGADREGAAEAEWVEIEKKGRSGGRSTPPRFELWPRIGHGSSDERRGNRGWYHQFVRHGARRHAWRVTRPDDSGAIPPGGR